MISVPDFLSCAISPVTNCCSQNRNPTHLPKRRPAAAAVTELAEARTFTCTHTRTGAYQFQRCLGGIKGSLCDLLHTLEPQRENGLRRHKTSLPQPRSSSEEWALSSGYSFTEFLHLLKGISVLDLSCWSSASRAVSRGGSDIRLRCFPRNSHKAFPGMFNRERTRRSSQNLRKGLRISPTSGRALGFPCGGA